MLSDIQQKRLRAQPPCGTRRLESGTHAPTACSAVWEPDPLTGFACTFRCADLVRREAACYNRRAVGEWPSWQGNGLWIHDSKVRVLPPQPKKPPPISFRSEASSFLCYEYSARLTPPRWPGGSFRRSRQSALPAADGDRGGAVDGSRWRRRCDPADRSSPAPDRSGRRPLECCASP
jgi:hypothetical protein